MPDKPDFVFTRDGECDIRRPTVYERFKDSAIDPKLAYDAGKRDAEQLFRELEPCGHPKNFLIGDEHGNFSCTVCEIARLKALFSTPEVEEFDFAVPLEAVHQIERWKAEHDGGKNPEDWFWLVGYLAGKALAALKSGDHEKAKHHCISTAAVFRNWHAHIRTGETTMRPGIEEPKV